MPLRKAIRTSGVARFRAIVLTSLTTFAGLAPLLTERSLQAKFLIPMAVSLAFGVLFATFITLLLVPAGYFILEDVKAALRRLFGLPARDVEDDEEDAPLARGAPASRQEREAALARQAVDREVALVEGEDAAQVVALGDADQGGVGEVHRQVAVLGHQLLDARHVGRVERRRRTAPVSRISSNAFCAGDEKDSR